MTEQDILTLSYYLNSIMVFKYTPIVRIKSTNENETNFFICFCINDNEQLRIIFDQEFELFIALKKLVLISTSKTQHPIMEQFELLSYNFLKEESFQNLITESYLFQQLKVI